MARRRVLVVLYGDVIGWIDQRSPLAEPEFTYAEDYADTGSTPLGVRLPVADTTYRGNSVRAFLEGLLPESTSTRSQWGARLGVDPGDAVGLLAHMGWDCPGAVQFCVRTLANGFPDAFSDALEAVGTPDATAIRDRAARRLAAHVETLVSRLDDPHVHG